MPTSNNNSKDLQDIPDSFWKDKLSNEQFEVTRLKKTEIPFTGKYLNHTEAGKYLCICCGQELFDSKSKYFSGSGWPSFSDVIDINRLRLNRDLSHGLDRIEVSCNRCGSHLGHLFSEKKNESGKYFCINIASLDFERIDKERTIQDNDET